MEKSARQEFYDDVLITAVEGGIGYWAIAKNYKWSDDGPTTVDVAEQNDSYEESEWGDWVHVDREALVRAFSVLRSDKELALSASIRERILRAWRDADAGEIDSDDADIVVQVAVLGDVIYG